MFYYGFDFTYILMILPAVLFSMWASQRVNGTYKRYSTQHAKSGITAENACRKVLDENGCSDVQIVKTAGHLTDHYDPRSNIIRLSESVYGSTSTAAIGVACHEAGHAIQYAQNYAPIKFRAAIVGVTNIGSQLSIPLVMIGLLFSSTSLAYLGVALFGFCVVFQLVTLPTEYNASNRAIHALEDGTILTDEEVAGSRQVLNAAALTYVAALAVSVMQLLRLLMVVSSRSRRD